MDTPGTDRPPVSLSHLDGMIDELCASRQDHADKLNEQATSIKDLIANVDALIIRTGDLETHPVPHELTPRFNEVDRQHGALSQSHGDLQGTVAKLEDRIADIETALRHS